MLLTRPAFWLAAMFMLGALAVRELPWLAEWTWLGWIAVLPPLAAFLAPKRETPVEPPERLPDGYAPHIAPVPGRIARRGATLFILALAVASLFLGAHRQVLWSARLDADRRRLPDGFFDATLIAGSPMRDHPGQSGGWRIAARALSVDGAPIEPTTVRLSGPAGREFRRGDLIRARVRRETAYPVAFPGAFDVAGWMERDGAAVSLAVVPPRKGNGDIPAYEAVPMPSVPPAVSARRVLDAIRSSAIEQTLLHGGDRIDGMLAAMLFGYRDAMDGEMRDVFRRVGIGHVLAISGLHVMLVVGLVWRAGSWLGLSSRRRAMVSLAAAALYLGVSGGQVAAVRATTMAFIHLGGVALGRKSDMLNSLALAALLITAINPSAPADVSFQLSFTAVAFIHLAVRGEGRNRRDALFFARKPGRGRPFAAARMRLRRELGALARVGVATWIGLFPIVMTVFHQVNVVGLVLNIFVIPWMSLVLAGGVLLPLLGWIPGASAALTFPAHILSAAAALSDKIPCSSFPSHAPGGAWLVVFYAASFAILLVPPAVRAGSPARRAVRAGGWCAMAAGLLGMAFSTASPPPPSEGRIGLLPSFSGDVMIVESPTGETTIIGAPSRGGLREANWLHYLKRSGKVTVVAATPDGKAPDCAALEYHFGVKRTIAIAAGESGNGVAFPSGVWTEIPDSGGVRLAIGRNRSGAAIWLAVARGGQSATVAARVANAQIAWRLRRKFAGVDAKVMVLSRRERTPFPDTLTPLFGKTPVALRGSAEWRLPPNWFPRDRYGALVVADDVGSLHGYDGKAWVSLKQWIH